ncbi:MAG: ATP-binding protein, partial [Rhodothermales bacterium]
RQVLTNLVENSIKYNNPGGCVQLTAERAEGGVRIVVQDNGIGISAVDLPRVTQRFFRADKSRSRSQGGTGLGLSIVKHILVGHGASLQIESELGIGSTFSFILPAA